jgi:threonine dehydrogenase-like Zn-dependent dehydrogenase
VGRTRRVAVISSAGKAEIVDDDARAPGPGEVRVRIEGCGVCGSNLPVWEGRSWFSYPLPPGRPGHEGWGEIVESGDGAADRVGERVAVLADDAFASEVTVEADAAIALPRELAGRAFPGEAFGSAWNVAARSAFEPGQTVAVVGIGFIGAAVTALAVEAGARVIALSRRPFSLEVARQVGAHDVVPLHERDTAVRAVDDLTDGRRCDVVVEAVGSQAPLDVAGDLTRTRGRLVIAGFHQDGPRTVDLQAWNWKGIDVVNAHERDPAVVAAGVRGAADAVVRGVLDPDVLLTHQFPLKCLGDALDAMVERPHGFLKAVVRP